DRAPRSAGERVRRRVRHCADPPRALRPGTDRAGGDLLGPGGRRDGGSGWNRPRRWRADRGSAMNRSTRLGLAGTVAQAFIGSRLTPLVVTGSVLLGLLAIMILPREEEPQIKIPVFDLFVAMPGASAAEVEARVSAPLERLAWEVPGVEYVYSTSQPGRALVV